MSEYENVKLKATVILILSGYVERLIDTEENDNNKRFFRNLLARLTEPISE